MPDRTPPDHELTIEAALARLGPNTREVAYQPPASAQARAFHDLVGQMFHRPTPDARALGDAAGSLGLVAERWRVGPCHYLALTEPDGHHRGWGAYLVREVDHSTAHPSVMLQVPHAYFEFGVRAIAARAMFGTPACQGVDALFVNTLHRYQKAPGERRKDALNPSDVAHSPDHPYGHATQAAADNTSGLYIFQLHGFGDRFAGDDPPDVIISTAAARDARAITDALATAMSREFSDHRIRRFPHDIDELGGLTNAQRKLLRGRDDAVFVHIEMSRRFRDTLLDDDRTLDRFIEVLFVVAQGRGHGGGNEQ